MRRIVSLVPWALAALVACQGGAVQPSPFEQMALVRDAMDNVFEPAVATAADQILEDKGDMRSLGHLKDDGASLAMKAASTAAMDAVRSHLLSATTCRKVWVWSNADITDFDVATAQYLNRMEAARKTLADGSVLEGRTITVDFTPGPHSPLGVTVVAIVLAEGCSDQPGFVEELPLHFTPEGVIHPDIPTGSVSP